MNTVDVRAKLAELGLELPVAAKPVAAYVPAMFRQETKNKNLRWSLCSMLRYR